MERLFELQSYDTELEQLRHRRANLPARAEQAEAAAGLAEIDDQLAEARQEREAIAREQRRLEDEVASLEEKAAKDDQALYGGSVRAVKELQALQEEIAALGRRQREVEDRILELMERAEPVDERIASLEAARAEVAARLDRATAEVESGEQEIDALIAEAEAKRAAAAEGLDEAVLRRYEAGRRQFGSSTVVGFGPGGCVGCPLQMPAVEVDRIKHEPEGSLLECEECGRLVVR